VKNICLALINIARGAKLNQDRFFEVGIIPDIVAAMQLHENNIEVQTRCCTALYVLCWFHQQNQDLVLEVDGVALALYVLRLHADNKEYLSSVCALLSTYYELRSVPDMLAKVNELKNELSPSLQKLVEYETQRLDAEFRQYNQKIKSSHLQPTSSNKSSKFNQFPRAFDDSEMVIHYDSVVERQDISMTMPVPEKSIKIETTPRTSDYRQLISMKKEL
jgi:hypothetical protein